MATKRTIIKQCLNCGKAFQAKSDKAKFHSSACKQAYYRYQKALQEGKSVTGKQSTGVKSNDKKIYKKICPHCHNTFHTMNSRAMYCSDSCKVVGNRCKQTATIRTWALLHQQSFNEAGMYILQSEVKWKYFYQALEESGWEYKPADEIWTPKDQEKLI